MKQNRDIINKRLIPELSKSLGKAAMSYRLGGSLATSYNSSEIYNFEKKDEGDIEIADPERSYLTTTLYPIASKDAISSGLKEEMSGRFTDNLYASLGDAENYSTVSATKLSGIFKVALKEYYVLKLQSEYEENSFRVYAKTLSGILRDVLKKYEINKSDNILSKATKITLSMRSVLIKYDFYKPESVQTTPTMLKVSSSVTLDGSFESFIPFDAEQRIIKEEVPSHSEIEDKAAITWSKTGSPIVQNSVSKEGSYSLYLDGAGASIKSQESLEYKPSESESLIIENWLKPDTITTSLLTLYGGTASEKGSYFDYGLNSQWTGTSANGSPKDYLFNGSSHYLETTNSTALYFKTNATSPEGQTLEMNVKVSTTSTTVPLTLISNKVTTWKPAPKGACAAIVYYGESFSNASYAGRVAVVTDNTNNTTEANGCLLISTKTYPSGSILNVAVVTYGNYIRLFINGKLEAFAVLVEGLNLSQNGTYINKCNWKATPSTFSYTLYALRFNNLALYTSDYLPSNMYSPRAIPKIKSLSNEYVYPDGISCGVRYLPNTSSSVGDKTIVYAALSDGENVFTAESTPIDPLKWNNIKLSIYKNTLILYINGVAYSSEIIPFDIELETISVGSSSTTSLSSSFSGYIDNFKMYKDETFDLEGVKYVDVRPVLNGTNNTLLEDFNPDIKWSTTTTPVISTTALATDILGSMINTTTTNPKIYTDSVVLDTQNFGIRTYIVASESQTSTIVKIGLLSIKLNALTITATTNDQVLISTPIVVNKLYKLDLRYNRGTVKLSVNNVDVAEAVETTLNTSGLFYYGWDGSTSLFKGYLGPLSIFDNNRNRIPAMDMSVEDFTTEKYYKNTVFSLTGRDNVYDSDDRYYFDNGYSEVLNDVVMVGSVVNSTIENGLYFKNGDYLTVKSNSNFVFGKEDFTIEFNVKTSVKDRRQVIVDRYKAGEGTWQTSINTDGNLYFTVTTASSYYFLQTTNLTLNDDDWHKVFIVRKGLEISVYVDNKLADKFGSSTVLDFFAARDLYIGYQGGNSNSAYNFEGYLNNIRITKGSLAEYVENVDDPYVYDRVLQEQYEIAHNGTVWVPNSQLVTKTIAFDSIANATKKLWIKTNDTSITNVFNYPSEIEVEYIVPTNPSQIYASPIYNDWSGDRPYSQLTYFDPTRVITLAYTYKGSPAYNYQKSVKFTLPDKYTAGSVIRIFIVKDTLNNYLVKINNEYITITTNDLIGQEPYEYIPGAIGQLQYNTGTFIGFRKLAPFLIRKNSNVKVENYDPTLYTAFTKTLRTFDSSLSYDSVIDNTWINNGTSLSSERTCNSPSALYLPLGTYQYSSGSQFKLNRNIDFCIEASIHILFKTADHQMIFSRGSSLGSLSYALCVNSNLKALRLIVYHDGSGSNATSVSIPYEFDVRRWYEIACCNKGGYIYFIINGVRYDPTVQYVNDFYQGSDSDNVYIGKLGASGFDAYFHGYIDSFKLSVGSSVYSQGFGPDAAYLKHSFNFTTLTQADTEAVPSLIDTGKDKVVTTLTGVTSSKSQKEEGKTSSAYFGQNSVVLDSTGNVLNMEEDTFAIIAKVKVIGEVGNRYIVKSTDTDKESFDLYIGEDSKLHFEIRQNGEILKSSVSSSLVPTNKWVSLGLVKTEQKVVRLSINGFVVSTLNNVVNSFETLGSECKVAYGLTSYVSYINIYKGRAVVPKPGENLISISFDNDLIISNTLTDTGNHLLQYGLNTLETAYGIDGKYTASGYFNGASSYVRIPSMDELSFGDADFDIEFEVYPTDGGNKTQMIISSADLVSPLSAWLYGSNYGSSVLNNRIGFGKDTDSPIIKSTTALYFDKWTFVRITRDGVNLRLYLDGILDSTAILTDEVFNFNKEEDILIGCSKLDVRDTYFKGYISSLKVSQGDIVRTINTDKYKVISALDFENSSKDLVIYDYVVNPERFDKFRHTWSIIKYNTLVNEPILKTITTNNEAAYFNGLSGFIYKNKNTHVSFKPFTVELKFMLTATSNSNVRYLLEQAGLYAIKITTDKRIEFNGGSVVLQSSANSISTNKWYHVAVTRDANKVTRLFLDGVKVGESSAVVNYSESNHYPICLGMYYSNYTHSSYTSYHFEGYMDNFYMINGVCKYTDTFVPNIPSDTVLANTSLAFVVGSAFKDTNTNVTWSASNMTVSSTKVKNKAYAMFSNSTSGYLQSTSHEVFKPGYSDFTIDLIVCPSQIISPTTLFDNRTDVTLARGLVVSQPTGNTGSFSVTVGSSLGTTDWDVTLNTGVNTVASGTYYHLRITRNLGKIYLFLDGVLKASADYIGDVPSSGIFVLGNRVSKNQGFTGYIEQFRYLDKTSLAGTTFAPFKQELI